MQQLKLSPTTNSLLSNPFPHVIELYRETGADGFLNDLSLILVDKDGSGEQPLAALPIAGYSCGFGDDDAIDKAYDAEMLAYGRGFAAMRDMFRALQCAEVYETFRYMKLEEKVATVQHWKADLVAAFPHTDFDANPFNLITHFPNLPGILRLAAIDKAINGTQDEEAQEPDGTGE